ncbi:hypothetical protein BB560_000470 [Smittium megazygosporum]|uniref:F-box domain-containing protein n=1 Tax=Smittium megazygosporum TaxID=133381 RepID=A0A2T9ZKB1_9FUNG|nr:hypothetical protein BB560_000470 [Smittium megazygosporum]
MIPLFPSHKKNTNDDLDLDESMLEINNSKIENSKSVANTNESSNILFSQQLGRYKNPTRSSEMIEGLYFQPNGSMNILTDQLLIEIFSLLDKKQLKDVSLVCHRWRDLSASLLWKRMVFPLEKRVLSSMKGFLSVNGRHITSAMIVPPIKMLNATTMSGGNISIPIAGSSTPNDSWSIPKPLSRSGSISSFSGIYPQSPRQPAYRNTPSIVKISYSNKPSNSNENRIIARNFSLDNDEFTFDPGQRPGSLYRDNPGYQSSSSFISNFPDISDSDSVAQFSSSSRRNSITNNFATNPRYDNSLSEDIEPNSFNTNASDFFTENRSLSLSSSSTPVVFPAAIPIPGTPGVGNTLSTDLGVSPGSGFRSHGEVGTFNSANGSFIERTRFFSISSSTISRLQQCLECYCPNIVNLTILNPNGITNHSRRMELLEQIFNTYPNLLHLNLSDFIMWDVKAMQLVAQYLHSLRSLNITNRVEVRDEDLIPVIQNCSKLQELRLRATNISDKTMRTIENNLVERIRVLDVGGCSISSEVISRIIKKTYNLTELKAWSCLRLNDDFLRALNPSFLSKLRVLDLMDVNGFSNEAIYETFGTQKWPNLRFLRIRTKGEESLFSGLSRNTILKLNSSTALD